MIRVASTLGARHPRTWAHLVATLLCTLALAARAKAASTEPADEQARAWIVRQGWTEGTNPDGSFVAVGTGQLPSAGVTPELRANAMHMATLEAKNRLADFLAARISATEELASSSPLAAELARRVPSPDTSSPRWRQDFKDAFWLTARAEMSGVTPEAVFESPQLLSVVIRCSGPGILAAAEAMRGGRVEAPASLEPMEPFRRRGATGTQDASERLHGVRLMRDAQHRLRVVAFGQARVDDGQALAMHRAADRAHEDAVRWLRLFASEVAEGTTTQERVARAQVLEEGRSHYTQTGALHTIICTQAAARPLPATMDLGAWDFRAADGSRQLVRAIAVVPQDAGPDDSALPELGSGARILGLDPLAAEAVGVGLCDDEERGVRSGPLIRRCKAIHAAVTRAKAEIARRLSHATAASAATASDHQGDSRTRATVRTDVLRRALAGAVIVGEPEILSTSPTAVRVRVCVGTLQGSAGDQPRLVFESKETAAKALLSMALQGLCPQGLVAVSVKGFLGLGQHTVVFAVALAEGDDGPRIAWNRASEALARLRDGTIEGIVESSASVEFPDALSAGTVDPEVRQTFRSTYQESVNTRIKPKTWTDGHAGLWGCVMHWAE